ncbi:hypothetical protein M885DRAFT_464553 [Pelagophyceae sp. CCMP2097]|nr:hypothetical protein M885DRAFT_464553 [Pelagophyceae sp. CCMP2097]
MAVFLSDARLQKRLVPGPLVERGHGLNLYAHPKEPKLVYGFGKFVVVRSLHDALDNFVYRGHKYNVTVARFSPNGFWCCSGDEAGFLRIWAWDNPEHLLKVEVQVIAGAIKDIAWDPDSKKIAIVGDGKGSVAKCIVWDTGNSVGDMVGHAKRAITCAFKPNRPPRIVTGSEDFKVCFYAGPPFKLDHSEKVHSNYVNCARYAPTGAVFATVGSDKKIVIYDGSAGTVKFELKGDKKSHPGGSVYGCAFSSDGLRLCTASADKKIMLWAVEPEPRPEASAVLAALDMGKEVGDMQMGLVWDHDVLASMALSGDLNYIVESNGVLSVDKVVQAPQAPISCMTVVDGKTIVIGCNDGTVFVADAAQGWAWRKVDGPAKSHVRAAHGGKVTALLAFPGGFASAGFDDKVRFASVSVDGAKYNAQVAVEGQPNSLAWLGGNVAASTTKGVCLLSPAGVAVFEATLYDAMTVAASGDGKIVVVGGKDGSLRLLDATTLAEVKVLPPHRGEITALAYSPDGSLLAAADADREIKIYVVASGYAVSVESVWRFHTTRVTALAWHPESTHLASTSNDEVVYIWSLEAPQAKAAKYDFTHRDGTMALAWLGKSVVSAGNDGCTCIWEHKL